MRLLLDTHAYLWMVGESARLSGPAAEAIRNPDADCFLSAASVWEITTKYRLGKLPEAALVAADVVAAMRADGVSPVSVTVEHAQLAGALPGLHRDPFDRLLAAQALLDGLQLISNDKAFDAFGVVRLW